VSALLLVLMILATYRLTRLVTTDKITERPRDALTERWGEDSLKAYFLSCDHCVSVYTSALVVGLTWIWEPLTLPVLQWGAVAGAASLIAALLDTLESAT
jgi:hypothetical protein